MAVVYTAIPTEAQWMRDTTVTTLGLFAHGRNNVYLHKIDAAVRQYHLSANTPSLPSDGPEAKLTRLRIKVLNLSEIINRVADWFKAKNIPSDNPRKWGGSKRGPYIAALAVYARFEMDSLLRVPEMAGSVPQQRSQWGPQGPLTHGQRVGALTRFGMLKTAVQHNVGRGASAGPLHGRMVSVEVMAENNPGGVNPRHLQGGKLAEMLLSDSHEHRHLFDYLRQADHKIEEIIYLQRNERWPHQIVFDQGIAYRCADSTGTRSQTVCCTIRGNFIVSKAGECYLINDDALDQQVNDAMNRTTGRGTNFRHTTFMAGEPVFFAGGVGTDAAGRIVELDSGSGHYKPSLKDIRDVLWLLDSEGVNVKLITVHYNAYVTWDGPKQIDFSMPKVFIADNVQDPQTDIENLMRMTDIEVEALALKFRKEMDEKFSGM